MTQPETSSPATGKATASSPKLRGKKVAGDSQAVDGLDLTLIIAPRTNTACFDPPPLILKPELEYVQRRFNTKRGGGFRSDRQNVRGYEFDPQGRPWFPVGFVPRFLRIVKAHGYRVRVIDHRVPLSRMKK